MMMEPDDSDNTNQPSVAKPPEIFSPCVIVSASRCWLARYDESMKFIECSRHFSTYKSQLARECSDEC
ncbi:hypothetical protein L1987_83129 [Smallanthus sonchifolius]|uniref:Uncharacterized protein n=1 Tax=Smallanthus sonchifolius TaxID=185202 RepID=A0ACB8YBL3_9ASTR|nr:hypothetical protein L1987_83129 [Smallanthus sonchifolius]